MMQITDTQFKSVVTLLEIAYTEGYMAGSAAVRIEYGEPCKKIADLWNKTYAAARLREILDSDGKAMGRQANEISK